MQEGAFFEQFIDDYYAECDEHLATIRRVLLAIEAGGSAVTAHRHELTRALHTLKGLSGMVGLTTAEEVAHAMEDALRAAPSGEQIAPEIVELLFAGERVLEATIASRRAGATPGSVTGFVDEVRRVIALRAESATHGGAPSSTLAAAGSPIGAAVAKSRTTYRFEFVPSAELASRGVGVERIRQRLKSIGEIVDTRARVRPSGGVAFDFTVAVADGVIPNEEWRDEGLSWSRGGDVSRSQVATIRHVAELEATAPVSVAPPPNVVRVDLARLDELMRLIGELVVARSRLGDSLARMQGGADGAAWEDVHEANDRIERQLRVIREGVMRIRLVPVGEVFERMRFAMRDIAREAGKEIRLEVSGQETELDKLVVDRMLEPLLHLVRNSASHGIESPAERAARGKPACGTINLRARAAGDRIILDVEDDGAGIDVGGVARRAVAAGLLAEHAELLPDGLLDVLCTPGFSTREAADLASGRGVGMAVVRTTTRALGGELFVHSVPGEGTRFTIELPLTLMITDALIVEIGDQPMAIPQIVLREIVPLDTAAVTRFENNQVFSHRGGVVPLVHLGDLFGLPQSADARPHVLIVGSEAHPAGLIVDRLLGLREIVVHPISDPLISVPGIAGATELADGRVSLILDAGALVRTTHDSKFTRRKPYRVPREAATTRVSGEQPWS